MILINASLTSLTDILARLSVYTVPSSAPSYTALVPHFLQPQSALPHTAVVIVLDWTRPWTFLEELHTWLAWIERWVQGDGARELEVIREEHRERCMSHLILILVSSVLTIASQGRRIFNITLNHPPSRSSQHPALSKARYSR